MSPGTATVYHGCHTLPEDSCTVRGAVWDGLMVKNTSGVVWLHGTMMWVPLCELEVPKDSIPLSTVYRCPVYPSAAEGRHFGGRHSNDLVTGF